MWFSGVHCFLTCPFIFCHYFGASYTFCTLPFPSRSTSQWSAEFLVLERLEVKSFEFFMSSQNGACMSAAWHLVSGLQAATHPFSGAKTTEVRKRSLKNNMFYLAAVIKFYYKKLLKSNHPAKSLQTHLVSLKSIFQSKLNWIKFLPRLQE